MAASILSRTISSVVDKRLVLSNDQCARTMAIGSTWTRVRIGMRFSIDPQGLTTSPADPLFYFGLCSGTTNMVSSATTTNFLGTRYTTGGAITYNANAGNPNISMASSSIFTVKRLGTTFTNGGSAQASGVTYLSANPTVVRTCWFLEILKGSPNYTLQLIVCSASATLDVSAAIFAQAMDASSASAAAGVLPATYTAATAATIAFDESAGALDTINISWGTTARPLEICDVAYARLL